jgi:hypothetical protein
MKALLLCIAMLLGSAAFAGDPIPDTKLVLVFRHVIGSEELVLGNNYVNALGDTINVRKFKYYLSNFSVTDQSGNTTVLPQEYFLVDEADPLSKTITLTIPGAKLKQISFLIGVDSIRNVSGVQEGTLDPLKGMFWTWNSGYIMAKLEGTATASSIAGNAFTYHIGGFRNPMNTLRRTSFDLSQTDTQKEIVITADINRWFKSKTELRIAETPVCHNPGKLAVMIADNYCSMFSLNPAP